MKKEERKEIEEARLIFIDYLGKESRYEYISRE